MRLQQLFEYQFPQIKHKTVTRLPAAYHHGSRGGSLTGFRKGYVPSPLRRKNADHLGTGEFASVYSNRDLPYDVRKVSRKSTPASEHEDDRPDGFYYYMMELANNPDNSNPYFPRFRDITVYELSLIHI